MALHPEIDADSIAVLLVDDEKPYVDILAKRLTKRKFRVETALSGSEGIQALRKQDFHVAVLDLKLGDMDGIEVLKIFKKLVPEMAVIMLTGHGSEKASGEAMEFGAFDYLTKPCELDDLVQKIRDSIRRR